MKKPAVGRYAVDQRRLEELRRRRAETTETPEGEREPPIQAQSRSPHRPEMDCKAERKVESEPTRRRVGESLQSFCNPFASMVSGDGHGGAHRTFWRIALLRLRLSSG